MTHAAACTRRATLAITHQGAAVALLVLTGSAGPLVAADLPRHDVLPRRPAIAVVPGPIVPPPSPVEAVVVAPGRLCAPGYALSIDGLCKRTDHLRVRCATPAGPCTPLPPDPLPYGIGPALRPAY